MDFDNKLKPKAKQPIKTNYGSFINPFVEDPKLTGKTFEEVRDIVKNEFKIDVVDDDNFNPRNPMSYRGSAWNHIAPSPSAYGNDSIDEYEKRVAPLTDLSSIYPRLYNPEENEMDVDGEIFYEYGTDGRDYADYKMDQYTNEILQKVRNQPEAEVMVYRIMPKTTRAINEGDWVTINFQYALMFYDLLKEHANNSENLPTDYHIVSKKVKAKDLWSGKRDNTDDIHSFGYYPK